MRMWTSFAYDLDPNGHGRKSTLSACESNLTVDIVQEVPVWSPYGKKATNFVFRADKSYIEKDSNRKEGVSFINSIVR
jgi:acetylcholinesterase